VVDGERGWLVGSGGQVLLDRAEIHAQTETELVEDTLDLVQRHAAEVPEPEELGLTLLDDLPDVHETSVVEAVRRAPREVELVELLRERRKLVGDADVAARVDLRLPEDQTAEGGRSFGGLRNLDGDHGAGGRRHPHQLRHVGVLVGAVLDDLLVVADTDTQLGDLHGVLLQRTGVASVPVGTTHEDTTMPAKCPVMWPIEVLVYVSSVLGKLKEGEFYFCPSYGSELVQRVEP
jgi:hypothetical protein